MKKQIDIIGAGFSGMTLAYLLAKEGHEVQVFEKNSGPGGLIGTSRSELGLAEQAANSILVTERALSLFEEIGFEHVQPLKSSKNRYLFRGTPRRWPLNFFETLGFIFRIPRLIFLKKWRQPRPFETLSVWGTRCLGTAANDYILAPALQGIYAGDHKKMSASLILGPLFSKNKKPSKGLVSGKTGMQDLIESLHKACLAKNVQFHFNHEYTYVAQSHPVVVSTSAAAAAEILVNAEPVTAKILKQIPMNSLVTATVFFKNALHNYQGFGTLIPRKYLMKTLGILQNPFIFPGRNKVYNETFILGGGTQADLSSKTDSELMADILSDRQKVFNSTTSEVIDKKIFRWKNSLPHYTVELEKLLLDLKTTPKNSQFFLHGNYLAGIGLSKIIDHSDLLMKELCE